MAKANTAFGVARVWGQSPLTALLPMLAAKVVAGRGALCGRCPKERNSMVTATYPNRMPNAMVEMMVTRSASDSIKLFNSALSVSQMLRPATLDAGLCAASAAKPFLLLMKASTTLKAAARRTT